jgi:hypothetical protein
LLIGPPQGFAQGAESSSSEPLRLTVAPHKSSRIAMKTLPKATCVLHMDGDNDTSCLFKLISDLLVHKTALRAFLSGQSNLPTAEGSTPQDALDLIHLTVESNLKRCEMEVRFLSAARFCRQHSSTTQTSARHSLSPEPTNGMDGSWMVNRRSTIECTTNPT